jgi:hypothetical protein
MAGLSQEVGVARFELTTLAPKRHAILSLAFLENKKPCKFIARLV